MRNKLDFKLRCPLCQSKFTVPREGAEAVPTNIAIKQLLDHVPPSIPKKDVPSVRCKVHKREGCEFVCTTCHVPLCRECIKNITKGPHATHTLDDIEDALASRGKEFNQLQDKLKSINTEKLDSYNRTKQGIHTSRQENSSKAEEKAEKAITEVVAWKTTTLKKIADVCEDAEINLEQQQQALEALKRDINAMITATRENLHAAHIEDVRKNLDDLKKALQEYETQVLSAPNIPGAQLSLECSVDLGKLELVDPGNGSDGELVFCQCHHHS